MRKPLFLLFIFVFNIYGGFSQGDAFKAFFWYKMNDDSLKHGCYGYLQIDSVSSSSDEDTYFSTLWLTYEWWFLRFNGAYTSTKIIITKNKSSKITRCSDHFNDVEWFSSFKVVNTSDTLPDDSLNFYFPMLPQGKAYGRYDYLTVDIDSLLDLEFYGAGDSIIVGTFVHKMPDSIGAVNILGRNAFIIELTQGNPLRISSIRCQGAFDSLLTLLLKFPLDTFKSDQDWYGINILDTLSDAPMIAINNLHLEGSPPYLRGSDENIKWQLKNKDIVDSCLISVAYDYMNWIPLGKTQIDSSFVWTIGNNASKTTIIQVMAYGKHGERIYSNLSGLSFNPSLEIKWLRLLVD